MTTALFFALASANAATPMAGLEWRPLSRADLMWIDDQRTSGLSVGEFDGIARPSLQFFAGAWTGSRVAVLGSLGVARLQNTTLVDDVYRQRHWSVVRPAVETRLAFVDVVQSKPIPWLLIGLYGDIPSVRDVSNGYTKEEQEAADELAGTERARLGGMGFRTGFGVDLRLAPGVVIGGQYAIALHRAVFQADDADAVTSWVAGEASLLLAFEWPGKERTAESEAEVAAEVTEPHPLPDTTEPPDEALPQTERPTP